MQMRQWVGVMGLTLGLVACGGEARPPCEGSCGEVVPAPGEAPPSAPAAPSEDVRTDAPDASVEETQQPVPPTTPPTRDFPPVVLDGGMPELPPDPDAQACVPSVTVAESIPEPAGGWDAANQPFAAYEAPPDEAPFGALQPEACVDDHRPALATWCERTIYDSEGLMVERTTRTPAGEHWTRTNGCNAAGTCVRAQDDLDYDPDGRPLENLYWDWGRDSRVHEWWQWSADEHLQAFLADSSHMGEHFRTLWRLRRACDGRPAYYDVSDPDRPAAAITRTQPFTYDASGRPTLEHTPRLRVSRAWDAAGHLRAEERWHLSSIAESGTRRYFDAAGVELANRYVFSGNMGEAVSWTWYERDAQGRVTAQRTLHHYGGYTSGLARFAYDAQGRKVLSWGTTRSYSGTGRSAARWTYACGTQDPVRYEEDVNADGTVESVKTWTWDPTSRTIDERQGPSWYWTRYRFDCAP